jgi:TetR/AcrR family transcriptional regulator, regulator of cefoperazone and chloramphenicol sensitivity
MTLMKNEETRQKLIESAGQIFADVGYDAATVRQITEKAQVNVASVNYYFGNKLQLYHDVLAEVFTQQYLLMDKRCSKGTPKRRLHALIELALTFGEHDKHTWGRALVLREISGTDLPKAPELVLELVRPFHQLLVSIVRDLMGAGVSRSTVEAASHSVTALFSHWSHKTALIQGLSPEIRSGKHRAEQTLEHIYQFALGGISNIARTFKRTTETD